jgi:uncharacterized protein YqjF (DUF2071 family)
VRDDTVELAVLTALAMRHGEAPTADVVAALKRSGLAEGHVREALARLAAHGLVTERHASLTLDTSGSLALLEACAHIGRTLEPEPTTPANEACPSIPWLTTVQTEWIDAVSLNYAIDPAGLASLLPAPLEPEIHRGTAWVQLLVSSLRDMRPQGLAAPFGVDFYQASYRAAVRYRDRDGQWRRGGYFVRSETNHAVMRAVGNALTEFKFHAFGKARIMLLRDGGRLTIAIEPDVPGGRVVAILDTRPQSEPPAGSVWKSLEDLHEPLVECYDAFGVDREQGWLYSLTIDREPWNARFVTPVDLYCEWFERDMLGARFDSVLHIPRCAYRWRPLRRTPLP